jgi:DNA-binding CsgD family transcriptional regulator/dipeptidyl aminopeptidase/acylaminoacyl peptidase
MPKPRRIADLTPREQEVLALLRELLTNEAIADRLGVSFETAKHHVAQVLAKLGVESREEAAAWQPAPEPSRWTPARIVLALGGTAVFASAVAGLALLAWGVSQAGGGAELETDLVSDALAGSGLEFAYVDEQQNIKLVSESGQSRITGPPGGWGLVGSLSWSPDGQKLAFTAGECLGGCLGYRGRVYVIDVGSGELNSYVDIGADDVIDACEGGAGLLWAPSGEFLAIGQGRSTTVVNISEPDEASSIPATSYAWSKDGRDLLTWVLEPEPISNDKDAPYNPCVVKLTDPNSGEGKTLARGFRPALSPDGSMVVYSADAGVDSRGLYTTDIRVVDIESGEDAIVENIGGQPWGGGLTRWWPDGTSILVDTIDGLHRITLEGEIVPVAPQFESAEFSPDGKSVLYVRHGRGDVQSIVFMKVDDETPVTLGLGDSPEWRPSP